MASVQTMSQCVAMLTANWPNEPWSDVRAKSYKVTLEDIEDELLMAATLKVLSEHKFSFMPKPATIREAAFDIRQAALGQKSAPEAWEEVLQQIRDVGNWGKPTWSSPLIERAVRAIGGWRDICLSENTVADRARFLEAYTIYQRREQEHSVMLPQIQALVAKLSLPAPKERIDDRTIGDDPAGAVGNPGVRQQERRDA